MMRGLVVERERERESENTREGTGKVAAEASKISHSSIGN